MASFLFKPVYVTKPALITGSFYSQLDSIEDTEKYRASSVSTFNLCPKDLHSNIDQDSSTSDNNLSANLISNFVSITKSNFEKNEVIAAEDDESEHLYIARPYKCWHDRHRSDSLSPNPLLRSLSADEIYVSESIFKQKVKHEDKAYSDGDTCKARMFSLQFTSQIFGKRWINVRSLKSAKNYYFTVPSFTDRNPFQNYNSIKRRGPKIASSHCLSIRSAPMQSSLSIQPSNLQSYTHCEEDTTTFVSHSKSPDCSFELNTNSECGLPKCVSCTEPNASTEIASKSIPSKSSALNRVNESERTRTLFAQNAPAKAYIAPDLFSNEVLHLKSVEVNHWIPCDRSDPEAKRMLFSELHLGQSIPGILPIQHMKYVQICNVHASYASALKSDLVLTANLILKVVSVLRAEFSPIQSKFLAVDNDLMANEFGISLPQKVPYTRQSAASYRFETYGITLFKVDYASVCRSEFWPNIVLINNEYLARIPQSEKSFARTLKISPILSENSCDISDSGIITPHAHLKHNSYSTVGSSNGPNQAIENRQMTSNWNESKCYSGTASFKYQSISEIFSKCAEDLGHLKSKFSENSDFLVTEAPAIDAEYVPTVSEQDEPVKLNVIKDTTGCHQLGDFTSRRVVGDDNPSVQVDMTESPKPSLAKLTFLLPKIPTNTDDCESMDSSTLIPEGYPGGWNANKENSGILLNCTAAPKPKRSKPMKQIFEMEDSEISENPVLSSSCSKMLFDQKPERDQPASLHKIHSAFCQSILTSDNCPSKSRNLTISFRLVKEKMKTGKLKNNCTLASRGPKKNLVTSVSDVAHAPDSENGADGKIENEESLAPTLKKEETKDEGVVQEAKMNGQMGKAPLCETDSVAQLEKKLKGDLLRWNNKDDSKHDSGESRSAGGISLERHPASETPSFTRRSCLVSRRTDLGTNPTPQILSLARNDYAGFTQADAYYLKKKELQMLIEKCRELRRELRKRSASKFDLEGIYTSISSSTSGRRRHPRRNRRSHSKNSVRASGLSVEWDQKLEKQKSRSRQKYHRIYDHKDDRANSSTSEDSRRGRPHKYRHWLTALRYPVYPPPPLHPLASYPYSSYPYYPPPPPALPQSHYMASPPWDFRNFHFSKQHRRHKSRGAGRHHHHRHRKAPNCKHKTKKEAKDSENRSFLSRITSDGSALSVQPPVTIPRLPRPLYHPDNMPITQSAQISPRPIVHQPPSGEGPTGTYHLPEAGEPPFNPFKGRSLPNEPPGLVETCIPSPLAPTKCDPPPISRAMPPVGEEILPNQDNQSQLYLSDRKSPTLGPLPLDSGSPLEGPPVTPRPPHRRMVHKNVQQRQPLSAIMGSAAPNQGPRPPPPTTPGSKADGPQVTSTGEKYGLFRMPLNQNEYMSCEERFDWLQTEKTLLEKSLNKLTAENGVVDHIGQRISLGSIASKEETRITSALNQIEREMSALRLVMKKYTNERKKGLLLKTTTF